MPDAPTPPVAPRRPVELTAHGDTRVDPWYWLRDRDDPDVTALLEAENRYTAAALDHTRAFQDRLFEEIRGRIQETDVSAPVRYGAWDYFARTFEGRQYAEHGRRPAGAAPGAHETVLLDENTLAGDSPYFSLGGLAIAPSHDLIAYSTDYSGGERYTLRFRDLRTGEDLPDTVEDVYYGLAWADDSRTIFYVRPDDAVRPYQVWRHELGTGSDEDVLVFEEADERFFVGVGRTRSGRYVVIASDSKTTSEVHFVPTAAPAEPPRVVEARTANLEYSVEHHVDDEHGDRFFVLTNADGAEDFKVMVTAVADPGRRAWTEVLPHRPGVRVGDVEAFARHLLVSEREGGLEQLRVRRIADDDEHLVAVPDPVYSVWAGENAEYETTTIRYGYSSLVRPTSAFDYDLEARTSTLVKQAPVLGGYDAAHYTSARLWATAADGTRVPMSVVHRTDVALDGTAPALLYGYGSYELSIDPTFSSVRLSLLDRGFVFAIAHIRGGGELGRGWYEDGKLMHKRNTFTDFIACAEHLIASGYTAPEHLAARGGSAGGLLMGAATELRPDLFRAVVAEVPFVDVVTTMADPSIPLTVTEWEEWGNPIEDAAAYEYMKSYSPYDNVIATDYPAIFVSAGLNDPRVAYWEPAKWVAKLRATKTDDRLLVLKTEMGAGHGGPSGRYDAWRDEAQVIAFLVDQLGGDLT
ncbi:MAG TPA: S9 family peptidase [Acidimicrobiia bacterium]